MKFTFEADMKKGECYACPLCVYEHYNGIKTYYCGIDNSVVPDEVDSQDCPLEEYQGIEWHPYPKEVPTQVGYYLVTMIPFGRKMVHVIPSNEFSQNPVIAWSELPKPYAN